MNRDDIMNIPAGPYMDALVVTKVMGYEDLGSQLLAGVRYQKPTANGVDILNTVPHYSTDIAAAFQVVETFDAWDIKKRIENGEVIMCCYVYLDKTWYGGIEDINVPLAICKASLLAVLP